MDFQTKVLIGDNTIEFGVNCANLLRSSGMYAITRPRDGQIIFNSIINDYPDVVIIDAVMPNMDAVELIKKIKSINKRPPKFIVTSPYDNPFLERQIIKSGADYFMLKPFDFNALIRIVNALAESECAKRNFRDIEIIVTDIIHMFGIPAHIKGYRYLREAIMLCLENRRMLDSVTKNLYPTIADIFCTSPSGVERAIRHAIEIMWINGNRNILCNHFGTKKPTNSELIAYITDKILVLHKPVLIGA